MSAEKEMSGHRHALGPRSRRRKERHTAGSDPALREGALGAG